MSAVFQVLTFAAFGALLVSTGYEGSVLALVAFALFALVVARPAAVLLAFHRSRLPRSQRLFVAWFGPKGVASMLFALFVLESQAPESLARLRRRGVRDPRLDPRLRPHRDGRGAVDRAAGEG